jgi:hypothetical protein
MNILLETLNLSLNLNLNEKPETETTGNITCKGRIS